MLKKVRNEKGFAVSTLLYGMTIVGVLVVLLIVTTAQFTSVSTQTFVSNVEENLNDFADKNFYGQGCPKMLYDAVRNQAYYDNVQSAFVTSTTGINLALGASNTNGRGVYKIASTDSDPYPIYYYRGAVTNNNVKFAGFCWKIVRTTETGGIKLIYNGTPDANGACTNTIGTSTQIGTSYFNNKSLLAASGYMYGTTYSQLSKSMQWYSLAGKTTKTKTSMESTNYYYGTGVSYSNGTYKLTGSSRKPWSTNYNNLKSYYSCLSTGTSCTTVYHIILANSTTVYYVELTGGETATSIKASLPSWKFGRSVTYSNGKYTLTSQKTQALGNWDTDYSTIAGAGGYHYTCLSTGTSCTSVKYIYNASDAQIKYMNLTNGKKVSDTVTDMTTNTNNSTIKTKLDAWYANNLNSYTENLEDTIWCNDRNITSLAGFSETGNGANQHLKFKNYNGSTTYPLTCSNVNDRFTVNTSTGNGKLEYPVGTLTKSEIVYAGCINRDTSCYLYTNQNWWTLTPDALGEAYNYHFFMTNEGYLASIMSSSSWGVRPAVSLKLGTIYYDGDGTATNPYIIPE